MTIEELNKLSDEELRARCGRAHGFTLVRVEGSPVDGRLLTRLVKPDGDTELQFWWDERDLDSAWPKTWQYMPNYTTDLNAMHEAWATLSEKLKWRFKDILQRVLIKTYEENSWLIAATARQRCIAFILTKTSN
jgi:hypothetical protein